MAAPEPALLNGLQRRKAANAAAAANGAGDAAGAANPAKAMPTALAAAQDETVGAEEDDEEPIAEVGRRVRDGRGAGPNSRGA